MDHSDVQVQNAIEIAWNPSAEQSLKAQAFDFLNQLRSNPAAAKICLSLFTRDPRLDDIVRHVSLEVVNNAVETGQLDHDTLLHTRDGLMEYIRRQSADQNSGSRPSDSPTIQNKLAQTLTYLFETLYSSGWETFFEDFWALARSDSRSEAPMDSTALLYLRILASVHDEIADQLVHTTSEKQKLFTELKDLIRIRDADRIAASWQEILSKRRQMTGVVIELCLKTISRWVSWTDISLVVNQSMISHLFQIASEYGSEEQHSQGNKIRDASIDVFTEIVGKKMKPDDKVDLIRFLNLNNVVSQLVASASIEQARGTPSYDTDMAETIARLVNTTLLDVILVLDSAEVKDQTREHAEQILNSFVPHLLRFFSDEYDEICSTVIPSLTELLTLFRKFTKSRGNLPEPYNSMIRPILDAIVAKMRYDDTSSWGEEGEETDEAEFQELRKRLRVLQQIVATVDESLYIDTISALVDPTLSALKDGQNNMNWRDVDLAMHETYLLGELAIKNGGLYQKREPSSAASQSLIRLMSLMIENDVAAYPHPAIHLQYMESCVRYSAFLEKHSSYIPKVLENFVRFVHSDHVKVKARSYHLFLRLTRNLRSHLGNIAESIVHAIEDLLIIQAEVSDDTSADDVSSNENSQSADAIFNSQLHLFEAIGCISSASQVEIETQVKLARSVIGPLSSEIEQISSQASGGDARALLQIHHLMMALGTFAKGFSDWAPGTFAKAFSDWAPGTSGKPVNHQVSVEFLRASNIILNTLQSLKWSMTVRTGARFAFSRFIGVLGFQILEQLPQWIEGLLAESSTKDEMATFLRLLDQVIFGFKTQIYDIMDSFFTHLLRRIFASLSEQTTGTDDEIQLGELRREYLNFLLIVLSNNLESVLVSSLNQGVFESMISTIEHFAKDTSEQPDAKLAMSVLTKMSAIWGGPDLPNPAINTSEPSPVLPGFDRFMMTRFSSLTWAVMMTPGFNAKDAQANRLIGEIATLQQTILAKTGRNYLSWLKDVELKNLGASSAAIEEYLQALTTTDNKGFKNFLLRFLQQGG